MGDGLVFLRVNVSHYSHAMLGIGCAFMPDFPEIRNFFYPEIYQPILEYRAYVLVIPFVVLVSALLPTWLCFPVMAGWAVTSLRRLQSFETPLSFWARLWSESPHPRTRTSYAEQLIREIERKMKRGENADKEAALARKLIEETVEQGGNYAG